MLAKLEAQYNTPSMDIVEILKLKVAKKKFYGQRRDNLWGSWGFGMLGIFIIYTMEVYHVEGQVVFPGIDKSCGLFYLSTKVENRRLYHLLQ